MKRIIVILVLTGLIAIAILFGTADSHHTNVKYVLWKQGIGHDWQHGLRYFNVDVDFRASLIGKSRNHLLTYFPVLRPFKEVPTFSQWAVKDMGLTEGEWIGDSPWLVVTQNGKVTKIYLVKG